MALLEEQIKRYLYHCEFEKNLSVEEDDPALESPFTSSSSPIRISWAATWSWTALSGVPAGKSCRKGLPLL